MREKDHTVSISCDFFGKSRQGYYDRKQHFLERELFNKKVLERVNKIRCSLPFCGTRKLHYLLREEGFKIGRDALFTLLRENHLLIKRKRKYVMTTKSNHTFADYKNLLKEYEINQAEQVFVSDITYIRTESGFCYLAIVADAYSKKIMGKFISKDMHTTLVLKALVESLKQRHCQGPLIHHSDHGSQYASRIYTNALKLSNMEISMAGKGKAWENPVAERIMGILKYEFGLNQTFKNIDEASKHIQEAIQKYNHLRPHLSCGYLTPEEAHKQGKDLKKVWEKKLSTYPQKERRKKEAKKE